MQFTKEQTRKRFQDLPEKIQDEITSPENIKVLQDISTSFGLDAAQKVNLEKENMLLMLGLVSPDESKKNLVSLLGIAPEKAETIVNQVNKLILSRINLLQMVEKNPNTKTALPTPEKPKPTFMEDKLKSLVTMPQSNVTGTNPPIQLTPKPQNREKDPYREPFA